MVFASVFLLYMAFMYKLPHVRNCEAKAKPESSNKSSIYNKISTYDKDTEFPYVQTDIPNVFYVATPKKGIKLYEFKNNKFRAIRNTRTLKVSLTLNNEKVPLNITYINKNGKTLGYGLYMSKDKKSTNQYAFFKLCDMPSNMSNKYDLMVLIDYDSFDVFNSNKTYSEVFQLSSTSKKASRFVSENERKLSIENGKYRNDFSIVTDHSTNNCDNALLFLSSRNYKISNGIYSTDIYSQKEYTKHPYLAVQDVIGDFFVQKDNSILYLKNDKNNGSEKFSLIKKTQGEDDKVIRSFDGNFKNGYIISGDYMLDSNNMTVYNLITDKESTLLNISVSNVKAFDISPDKTRIVVVGKFENGKQRLFFYDLKIKRYKVIDQTELVNEDYPNLRFIDNDKVSYIRPSKSSDALIGNMVVSWEEIFSKISD